MTGVLTPLASICMLQGVGLSSPFQGSYFRVRGVVTLDYDQHWRKGFHLQEDGCDADTRTSDALYVYLDEKIDVVNIGDYVEVNGEVHEYYGLTELLVKPDKVMILSRENELPAPVELHPPFDNQSAREYFEARESMLVSLGDGNVVGPTDSNDRTWLVRTDLNLAHVFYGDPTGTGEIICVEDESDFEISPGVRTGDRIRDLKGVLTHRSGLYCLELTGEPQVILQQLAKQPAQPNHGSLQSIETITAATFNLFNFFDTQDDPLTEDSVFSGPEYQRRLQKHALVIHEMLSDPDILAFQEVENISVLQDLANRPETPVDYAALLLDGPDLRGMDVGFLYRTDRVKLIDYMIHQGCTQLADGLGPDGNLDPQNPENNLTCDLDNDQILDGNRLFSRPPLVMKTHICPSGLLENGTACLSGEDVLKLWLIDVHLKSKLQDTSTEEVTLPRRVEQSQFISTLIEEMHQIEPDVNILLLGDLNDNLDSQTIQILESKNLVNLTYQIPLADRYTYIYQGISHFFDYVFARNLPGFLPLEVNAIHINADYPYELIKFADSVNRSSDHDIVWVKFGIVEDFNFLPFVSR